MRFGGAAMVAGALVVTTALAGCGSMAPQRTTTATVTVAPTAPPTAAPEATPTASGSPTPLDTPSAGPTATSADPGRPAGQCADSALGVSVQISNGGGGAGSEYYYVLFTNTGGASCVLRGTPGVSVVGDGNGTQIGPAADRVQTGVKDVRLPVGGTVAASLKVVNIGTDGGPLDGCDAVKADGYRVYPPHSKRAFLVEDPSAVACTNGPVFMTVSPVVPFSG